MVLPPSIGPIYPILTFESLPGRQPRRTSDRLGLAGVVARVYPLKRAL